MVEQLPTILEWHAFLYSSSQIGTMRRVQSSCTPMPPAPVVMGPTGMGPGSEATAHTSASRAGRRQSSRRSPETPPPQSCGPFNVYDLQGRDQEVIRLLSQI